MALSVRKKPNTSGFLVFFLGDWKFLLQVVLALLAFGVAESLREVFFDEGARSLNVSPAFVFQTNILAAVSLLFPALLFALAGKSLFPSGSAVAARLTSILFFAAYIGLTLMNSDPSSAQLFHWSIDRAFQTTNFSAAAATSLLAFSAFVVCYRFVTRASGFLIGTLRLCAIVALVSGLSMTDRLLMPESFVDQSLPLQRLRLIIVVNDLSFEESNDFLTKDADERFLNSVKLFRPVVMPSEDQVPQWATLLTGLQPFDHGIRENRVEGQGWELFSASWLNRKIALETHTDLHFTNIMTPSVFTEFFSFASGTSQEKSLCPDREKEQNAYQYLKRVRERLVPFVPQWMIQKGIAYSSCVPLKIPADQWIHHEFMNGLAQMKRRSQHLTSLWSVDLHRFESPLSEDERHSKEPSLGKRRNLVMLLRTFRENLEILQVLDQAEIHVVGLTEGRNFGSYFYSAPGFTRDSPWPLPEENLLLSLSDLSRLLGNDKVDFSIALKNQQAKLRPLYFERGNSSTKGSTTNPISMTRSTLCTFESQTGGDPTLLQVTLPGLHESPRWTQEPDSELGTVPFSSEEACVRASLSLLDQAIQRDVQLFEPIYRVKQSFDVALQVYEKKEESP